MGRMCRSNAYKSDAIKAAKQLCYPEYIIEQIKNAKSDTEIERIIVSARKEFL